MGTIYDRGSVDDDDEIDELDELIEELERRSPGTRCRMEQMRRVIEVTTALWQRREAIGLTVEEVAERSGLSLDEVERVEDNDVDSSFQRLAQYAAAVGLQFELQQVSPDLADGRR